MRAAGILILLAMVLFNIVLAFYTVVSIVRSDILGVVGAYAVMIISNLAAGTVLNNDSVFNLVLVYIVSLLLFFITVEIIMVVHIGVWEIN